MLVLASHTNAIYLTGHKELLVGSPSYDWPVCPSYYAFLFAKCAYSGLLCRMMNMFVQTPPRPMESLSNTFGLNKAILESPVRRPTRNSVNSCRASSCKSYQSTSKNRCFTVSQELGLPNRYHRFPQSTTIPFSCLLDSVL